MRSKTVSAVITYTDDYGVVYRICRLDQTDCENGDFTYEFRPCYEVIDLLPEEFEGIPGLDLDLRREVYVRENRIPVFIAERTPPRNRENIHEELAQVGLEYYDALEWLLRTDKRYFGDHLHVIRVPEEESESYDADADESTMPIRCRNTLTALAEGRDVIVNGRSLEPSERRLLAEYTRTLLRDDSASKKNTAGRRPLDVDPIDIDYVCRDIRKGRITLEQGLEILGISRATLYRRMKQFKIEI